MSTRSAGHTTTDPELHRKRRAPLNPFFSKQNIASREPVIQNQIEKLTRRIDDFTISGDALSIGIAYCALTMDIVSEYATGKSYGSLDYPDFNQEMAACVSSIGKIWRIGKHFYLLWLLMMNVPNWILRKLDPKSAQFTAFENVRMIFDFIR